ncbi:autotransporter outer membrane beta-barrel domain-containing protein, partial [Bartonella grahamii]|uniref:autotransporter outer membrane beta-barrel domain-containing protein n=1 Tax=Bartonella grahamii TaxID=33045 RepID=UPI001ABB0F60
MYKKSLLLYTAAMTVTLFGTHFNAYAANNVLKNDVKGTVTSATSGSSYDAIEATNGGEIKGENLIVTSPDPEKFSTGVASKDSGSEITLTGTTIVEKVKNGLFAEKGGKITSENLIINGTNIGLVAQNSGSKIELTGKTTIGKVTNGLQAVGGAAITSKDLTITLNEAGVSNVGVSVQDSNSKIELKGKTTIKNATNHGLMAVNGAIVSEDLTLIGSATQGTSIGIGAYTPNSKIELKGKTVIEKFKTGLVMNNGAAIKIDGASITASEIGASFIGSFNNSKNNETTLENVNISSADDDALMNKGINAEKSTVTLNNVTVTQANTGIFANDHSTITVSGGSFDGKTDGVYAKQGSTINLTGDAKITSTDGYGLHAEGPKSKITKTGGTVSGKQNALFAEKGGQIDATNVALTTDGKGTGAVALGPDSRIELHGDTTINNTLDGLGAVDGGKITSENLTVMGGEAIDQDPDKNRSGIWTEDAGSEITLTGKTIIKNVDEGFYADGGSKIISGDLTIIGGESEKPTVGVNTWEADSIVELNGKTTIQNVDIGLATGEDGTTKMVNGAIDTNSKGLDPQSDTPQNGKKNKIEAKKAALVVINGGHIDLKDVSATAEVAGLQFATFSDNNPNGSHDPQRYHSNEINLTNAELHTENGTGIFVGTVVEKSIEDAAAPSIGTVNLKKSEVHADVLLGDGIFWDKMSWKDKDLWDGKEVKAISNGTFTLSADQSILEGRANIAKDRNVHFDLKNDTTWTLKISKNEKDDNGNLLDIAQRSRSDISTLHLDNSSIIFSKPTEEHYQTLHIGSGKPDSTAVYNATGDAKIYFNAEWSDGAA